LGPDTFNRRLVAVQARTRPLAVAANAGGNGTYSVVVSRKLVSEMRETVL
jgi:hypothetical protein